MTARLILLFIGLIFVLPTSVHGQADPCHGVLAGLQQDLLAAFPHHVESIRSEIARENGPLTGYALSHGDVVLKGMGLTLVQFDDPGRPELLFYRPTEAPASEWLDFDGPDGPYELVGWGYLPGLYSAEPSAPEMECIPSEAWFVHEAGWHLLDGDMRLTPEARREEPDVPADLEGSVMYWHPAGWDIHLWVREEVPEISLLDPTAGTGGLAISGAFWYPSEGRR